jgi:hypothetical protein
MQGASTVARRGDKGSNRRIAGGGAAARGRDTLFGFRSQLVDEGPKMFARSWKKLTAEDRFGGRLGEGHESRLARDPVIQRASSQ